MKGISDMDKEKEITTAENVDAEELKNSDPAENEESGEVGERQAKAPSEKEDFFTEALAALQKERDQYYDQLLRKQAEFENYRKRVEREKADARFAAKQEILRELLNVLDACERGLNSIESAESRGRDAAAYKEILQSYREGYELLHKQIQSTLAKFGVEEISAVGEQFNPNIHEAVLHEPSESHREGEVMEEMKKGYRLHDRLLRAAQVKVARSDD